MIEPLFVSLCSVSSDSSSVFARPFDFVIFPCSISALDKKVFLFCNWNLYLSVFELRASSNTFLIIEEFLSCAFAERDLAIESNRETTCMRTTKPLYSGLWSTMKAT